jgi:hypothetical protein
MELNLTNHTKIRDVKKQFCAYFPYLKLEFFKGEGLAFGQKLEAGTYLNDVSARLNETGFYFDPSSSVAEFELRLRAEHGLTVRVFRKYENMWLETVQTDNLSLKKQNEMGRRYALPLRFNINALFL